jgi:hypothetical protein
MSIRAEFLKQQHISDLDRRMRERLHQAYDATNN